MSAETSHTKHIQVGALLIQSVEVSQFLKLSCVICSMHWFLDAECTCKSSASALPW